VGATRAESSLRRRRLAASPALCTDLTEFIALYYRLVPAEELGTAEPAEPRDRHTTAALLAMQDVLLTLP
jgi:hypothetical protein